MKPPILRGAASSRPNVSLFGKLPTELDFVRIHHDFAEALALDGWLHAALQRLVADGTPWPAEPFQFVFAPAPGLDALVGVVVPSRDRAGRAFPAAIFARLPRSAGSPPLAAATLASQVFGRDAVALLREIAMRSVDDLELRLRELHSPGRVELLEATAELDRVVRERSLKDFAGALFNHGDETTAFTACARLAAALRTSPRSGVVFECPVQTSVDVAMWASLAERASSLPPSWIWSAGDGPARMLLAAGSLPARVPAFWAAPDAKHGQLCALRDPSTAASFSPPTAHGEAETLAALIEALVKPRRVELKQSRRSDL